MQYNVFLFIFPFFRLSDATGEMVFKKEKEGLMSQTDLDTNVNIRDIHT